VQLLRCLLLSSSQLESTLPPPAQWLLSQSQHGNLSGIICNFWTSLREFPWPSCEPLYMVITSHWKQEHLFMNILCIESFYPQNMYNRTLFFGSLLLKHGHNFDYWDQPLNMRMSICYLVIHIENLVCPFQLFYFHLWPIYWLPHAWFVLSLFLFVLSSFCASAQWPSGSVLKCSIIYLMHTHLCKTMKYISESVSIQTISI
jgi:hypothetical protein